MYRITLEIELTDEEYRVVGRDTAGMIEYLHTHASPIEWSLTNSLIALLRRAIREELASQEARDNAAALLRRTTDPLMPNLAPQVPDWLKALDGEKILEG